MTPSTVAKLFSGRMHYAWIVLVVVFCATLAGVGVRAAPGVIILPLQRAFGWDVATISGAIGVLVPFNSREVRRRLRRAPRVEEQEADGPDPQGLRQKQSLRQKTRAKAKAETKKQKQKQRPRQR